MWVEQSNNKFKYREYYNDPLTDKKKTVSIVHEKNAKPGSKLWNEIALLLQGKIDKKTNENPLTHDNLTIRELVDSWLKDYKDTVKESSYLRIAILINPILKEVGDVKVSKIKASHFNTLYNDLLTNRNRVYRSIKQMDSVVKRLLKYAYKYYGINKSELIELLEVPRKNISPSNDYKFLERHELQAIIDYLEKNEKEMYARIVYIMANCGMRYGELVSIDYVKDIDFNNQSMTISKTYSFTTQKFTSPKTNKERTIYFSDAVADTLKKQIKHSQLRTIKYNLNRDNTLLFKSTKDNPVSIAYFNKYLQTMPDIDKHLTSHIFRHTFISIAIEQGINKDLIQQQVGHADSKMIDTIYGHVTAGIKEQQKKAMQDFKII